MKSIKDLREDYNLITEKEEHDMNKLSQLVRAGLFDAKKLSALKRAMDKPADKMTAQEKRMMINLLDSLMAEVLSDKQVYRKIKQDVMKEAKSWETKDYLSKNDPRFGRGFPDQKEMPSVLLLKRKGIRVFPDGQKIGLYYAQAIDKYVSIPFQDINISGHSVNEETQLNELGLRDIVNGITNLFGGGDDSNKKEPKYLKPGESGKTKLNVGGPKEKERDDDRPDVIRSRMNSLNRQATQTMAKSARAERNMRESFMDKLEALREFAPDPKIMDPIERAEERKKQERINKKNKRTRPLPRDRKAAPEKIDIKQRVAPSEIETKPGRSDKLADKFRDAAQKRAAAAAEKAAASAGEQAAVKTAEKAIETSAKPAASLLSKVAPYLKFAGKAAGIADVVLDPILNAKPTNAGEPATIKASPEDKKSWGNVATSDQLAKQSSDIKNTKSTKPVITTNFSSLADAPNKIIPDSKLGQYIGQKKSEKISKDVASKGFGVQTGGAGSGLASSPPASKISIPSQTGVGKANIPTGQFPAVKADVKGTSDFSGMPRKSAPARAKLPQAPKNPNAGITTISIPSDDQETEVQKKLKVPQLNPAKDTVTGDTPAFKTAQDFADAGKKSREGAKQGSNSDTTTQSSQDKDKGKDKEKEGNKPSRSGPGLAALLPGLALGSVKGKPLTPGPSKLSLNISGPKREGDPSAIASRQSSLEREMLKAQSRLRESVDLDGNLFELNSKAAKKVTALYESLNTKNKKKMVGMMNESAESLEKVISFAVRQ